MDNNVEKTSNTPTHKWRCVNCGEMAYSDICSYCGKESYHKTDDEKKASPIIDKPNKTKIEKSITVPKKAENDGNQDIKTVSKLIDSASAGTNELKRIIVALTAVILVLGIVFLIFNLKIQSDIKDLADQNNELQKAISSQSVTIEEPPKETEKIDNNEETLQYIVHIVKYGESLEKICAEYNIDYQAYRNIILSMNGISNPSVINVGQAIILPIFK